MDKVIEEKISKGEELTKEETHVVLKEQEPVEDFAWNPPVKEVEAPKEEVKEEVKEPEKPAESVLMKLEVEMAKPEGKEDLAAFNETERAYYHQMKRDRSARQDAVLRADLAEREVAKLRKQLEVKPEPDEDPLKDKSDDDILTVKDVKALLKPKPEPKVEVKQEAPQYDPRDILFLNLCEQNARTAHEDFDAVVELMPELINNNPQRLNEISKAIEQGKNPAVKAYELIKSDPEFSKLYPAAALRAEAKKRVKNPPVEKSPEVLKKEEAALKAQEQIETNLKKTKTTGNVETSETGADISEEEYFSMSDRDYAKLPAKTRSALRKKFG